MLNPHQRLWRLSQHQYIRPLFDLLRGHFLDKFLGFVGICTPDNFSNGSDLYRSLLSERSYGPCGGLNNLGGHPLGKRGSRLIRYFYLILFFGGYYLNPLPVKHFSTEIHFPRGLYFRGKLFLFPPFIIQFMVSFLLSLLFRLFYKRLLFFRSRISPSVTLIPTNISSSRFRPSS